MNREDNDMLPNVFHPRISAWFAARFGSPTEIQRLSWPRIAAGEHVLLTAPTGTGKTMAVFLWAINQLAARVWEPGGIRVLYVSPLKALNNDIQRNLLEPLGEIRSAFDGAGEPMPEIRVLTRSGDTPQTERRRMLKKPPEILITTPESLNLLLASPRARGLFTGVATVILDEIHAVAAGKRGTHLITAVDRLVLLSGEFQRLAVSATVRPLERIAQFVAGFRRTAAGYEPRPMAAVQAARAHAPEIRVEYPIGDDGETRRGTRDSVWVTIADEIRRLIAGHRSTLVFVNSRQMAEKLTRLINEGSGELIAYAHHGSLSRELRRVVEKRLKAGELSAIVATSSLELGIDIGDLDLVVLVQTPFSVNAAVQRIGRAGHSVGLTSRGVLFAGHARDLIDAAVLVRLAVDQEVEELRPVRNPLDVLSQIIVSMVGVENWSIDILYDFVRTSWPFHTLRRDQYDAVVEMLAGRYQESRVRELKPRVSVDRVQGTIVARPGALQLVYMSGGTIPDRGYYKLKIAGSQAVIGELDEEFVWERKVGDTFSLGTQNWKIAAIDHQKVEVLPWNGAARATVFWRAEGINRDFELGARIGTFLEHCNERIGDPDLAEEMVQLHEFSLSAAEALCRLLSKQRAHTGADLPHRHHVLVEYSHDPATHTDMRHIFIHTLWGNRVNYPLALALRAAWSSDDFPVDFSADNDGIHIVIPDVPGEAPVGQDVAPAAAAGPGTEPGAVVELLDAVTRADLTDLIGSELERSGFFGARFRENAGRALLLPKASINRRTPLWVNRLKAKNLLRRVSGYRNFPIVVETWRECIQDEFDIDSLRAVLDEIADGVTAVTEAETDSPSPFAAGSLWRTTNQLLYGDDQPAAGGAAPAVDGDVLKDAVFESGLRPVLDPEVVRDLEQRLQRVADGYAPRSSQELIDWVTERILIPEAEWRELTDAIARDAEPTVADGAAERLVRVRLPAADLSGVATVESAARVSIALGISTEDVEVQPVCGTVTATELRGMIDKLAADRLSSVGAATEEEPAEAVDRLLAQWLSFYGPVGLREPGRVFGLCDSAVRDVVSSMEDAAAVVVDVFCQTSTDSEVCDATNLERILAFQRRRARPTFEPLPAESLPLFLAVWQRIAAGGTGKDELKRSLERLMGYPAAAADWEEWVLPARVPDYVGHMLDELLRNTDLEWFGCGRGRTSFCFADDFDLFAAAGDTAAADNAAADNEVIPDTAARYSFWDLQERTKLSSKELSERLWNGVWAGRVRCDDYEAVRRAALRNFAPEPSAASVPEGRRSRRGPRRSRSGFAQWKASRPISGSWYRVREPSPADLVEEEELNKERVRFLLSRYGVVFRELLTRELPPLRWGALFRTMRIMELSGEIVAGHFFEGIRGLQFASHAALRALRGPLSENVVYVLNAADPASLCGVDVASLKSLLPQRYPSTFLVFRGKDLVLTARRHGEELETPLEPDDPGLPGYLRRLNWVRDRDYNPKTSVKVKSVNGCAVNESAYEDALKAAGFIKDYRGYSL